MPLAVYVKAAPKEKKIYRPRITIKRTKNFDRFFFILMTIVGLSSMVFAAGPIFFWQIKTLPRMLKSVQNYPVPQQEVLSVKSTLASTVQIAQDPDGFSYFTTNYKPQEPRPSEFYLSIPKLEIEKALVKVDTIKFDKNLSLFPGAAIPGEIGNSFITGHSVLPQFFSADNYRTIFSHLSDLEVGDEVLVELEGKQLRYVVQYSKIVDPHDLSVLAPISANARNLTLMSCVPPGTNSKRLVVITSLI